MTAWSLFKDLHAGSTTWGLKVRIVRIYKQTYANSSNAGTMEMVLHDETGDRIHASMYLDVYEKFKENLVEGGLCRITHVMVKENDWKGKTTTNKQRLQLFRLSKVFEFKPNTFPTVMHDLKEFNELIIPQKNAPYQLIDVIGRVTSYLQPTKLPALNKRIMEFRIVDSSGSPLDCCVWDEYIDCLFPILEHNINKTCIVLIKFGRVCDYRGELRFQNTYHVTQIIVNGEDDVFLQFTNRMEIEDGGGCNKLMFSEYEQEIYVLFSQKMAQFRDLKELNAMQNVSNFWVEATIIDIETKTDYWYLSCKNCAKKIYDDGNIKKCWTCNEQSFSTTYRYKIIVSVLDHTGTSTFLLWNRECAAIIGKSAGEMRDLNVDGSKQGDKMVEDALLDKKILFEVRKQTIRNNNNKTYFIVNRIVLNEDILEIYRQNLITDNESTTGLTSEMNNKSLEMIEESSRNRDDKGKGIYLEDEDEDINEKGNADEVKQVAFHEENPETDDAYGAKSPQTSSESVADDQIKPRRVSDATTDATYMLKRKRIKKEK
ncbi:hypothetical protein CASFOL_017242 [Castilleja foliolosa]|uniref:Replication factor A C-terminal domain-containing protein n=1 Tax=Castilleja foliolosa TaxID=1961234 RepID=A0ABD3DAK8_9LAMI